MNLSKLPFRTDEVPYDAASLKHIETFLDNDVYKTFNASFGTKNFDDIRFSIIAPASDKHIAKYSRQEFRIVTETPELYESVVAPYIESTGTDRIQWVYNILEGTSEAERVIARDDDPKSGYVVMPDLKWDGKTLDNLYCLVIAQDRSLRSIRNLTAEHLPLLRKIESNVKARVAAVYDIDPAALRLYFHYQPTYYHLHVHVTHVTFLNLAAVAGNSHLLRDIIDLLEIDGDILKKRTFTYALGTLHPLYGKICDASDGGVE